MKKTTHNKNANYINTAAIGDKLHKHLAERAKLQQKQDQLWSVIKRDHRNHSSEMKRISDQIGANTYAIDGLINQLIHAGGRPCRAHYSAIDYLKREIARNQRIASRWEQNIREVRSGIRPFICSDGTITWDVSSAIRYVEKKKQKFGQLQRKLSQLQNWLQRAA